ncbi:hypothetical protein Tsubulata_046266, partial [Turnera subulata]
IVGKELFRVLKENWSSDFNSFISEKIVLVPSDISLDENLGVKNPNLREEMWSQLDVIVNLAATTNFDERYDIALGINTFGAKNVVCFAKKCVGLEIPADMVVNTMLVAMVAHAIERPSQTIYHIGSSKRNPMTYRNFGEYGFTYFTGKPWIGKDGKPVKVGWPRIMGSLTIFHIYVAFRYLLLLQALAFANYFHGIYSELVISNGRSTSRCDCWNFTCHICSSKGFDDKNTEKLQRAAQKNSKDSHLFYFDPKTINWEDYFLNAHFNGVRR